MSRKIRIGNDIDITWSLIDQEGEPYLLEGRDVSIELEVMSSKRIVKIKDVDTSGNTVHFIFYGKDQKYTGHYHVKFIENNKEVEMVTFDIQDVFQLVEHSWLAADEGQDPERVEIESITIESQINTSVGPDKRANLKNAVEALSAQGVESVQYEGVTLPVSTALQMISAVEAYAALHSMNEARHKDAINAKRAINTVDAYDFTGGFPEPLRFEV